MLLADGVVLFDLLWCWWVPGVLLISRGTLEIIAPVDADRLSIFSISFFTICKVDCL